MSRSWIIEENGRNAILPILREMRLHVLCHLGDLGRHAIGTPRTSGDIGFAQNVILLVLVGQREIGEHLRLTLRLDLPVL